MNRRDPRQMVKMILAAALTGGILIALIQYLLLPALVHALTESQIDWLRHAFAQHLGWVLAAIVAIVALLGAPVLLTALWVARLGPWREKTDSRREVV